MRVTWQELDSSVEFTLRWPSRGWAAIGINPQSGLPARDPLHHTLVPGVPYYMLVAYSADQDFAHHSLFRSEVVITFAGS